MHLEKVTHEIIGAAIVVHRELGPGLLESTYEACLYFELVQRGLRVERQKPIPLTFKGNQIECAYRADLLVENSIILELKAVDRLDGIHTAQVLTYLKLSRCVVGLIINFNVRVLVDGVKRVSLRTSDSAPDLRVKPGA